MDSPPQPESNRPTGEAAPSTVFRGAFEAVTDYQQLRVIGLQHQSALHVVAGHVRPATVDSRAGQFRILVRKFLQSLQSFGIGGIHGQDSPVTEVGVAARGRGQASCGTVGPGLSKKPPDRFHPFLLADRYTLGPWTRFPGRMAGRARDLRRPACIAALPVGMQ